MEKQKKVITKIKYDSGKATPRGTKPDDEWCTQMHDIVKELSQYGYDGKFRGKTIICPCDWDILEDEEVYSLCVEFDEDLHAHTNAVSVTYASVNKIDGKMNFHRVDKVGIEEFLRKRWRIYRDVNFHHSVHKSELIMRKILIRKAEETFAKDKDFDSLIEENEDTLPSDFITGIMLLLVHLRDDGNQDILKKFILSLDDSWLDTLMKLFDAEIGYDNELINGREVYKTVLKRFNDYLDFDELVYRKFFDSLHNLKEKCFIASKKSSGVEDDDMFEENHFVDMIQGFLLDVEESQEHQVFLMDYYSLFSNILLWILENLYAIDESMYEANPIDRFDAFVSESEKFTEAEGVFLGALDFGTGIPNDSVYKLWSPQKNALIELNRYSAIKVDLECEKNLIPPFHLYAKRSIENLYCQKIVSELFCNFITQHINDYLDKCIAISPQLSSTT